ncbi:MAG: DUF1800 family protein [Acidobacteria bacterium]|nr:DUF1800 family protein [Acidobacteriota bacterium]
MATFDAQITSWTVADVQHFGRRAGFGLTPEQASTLAAQAPGPVIDAWVDDTLDKNAFNAALPRADVVPTGANGNIPADPAPHPFRLDGWRRQSGIPNAQAHFAWRMQYNPNPLQEKLALFWHQLLATGAEKVDNPALTTKQVDLFRSATARGPFGALLLAVSQDPAMMIWLDTILNRVRPGSSDVANENYAREILELYSLGVDNGYNQQDITNLARAFSGWTLTPLDVQTDPNNANNQAPNDASWRVNSTYHATGTITFLGQSFDIGAPTRFGQDLPQAILTLRGPNAAQFLATRLLRFFVDPAIPATPLADLQALILAQGFDVGKVLKAVFKSQYFYAPQNRYNLYEGPVAWTVRAARMLCPTLAAAAAVSPVPAFAAWRLVVNPYFSQAGQAVLDPDGPNGWKEHGGWINSNTMRYRGKLAAALALGETTSGLQIFPSTVASWFPSAPASAVEVFNRLVALLQPAPIPNSVRDAWLSGLWSTFTWDNSSGTQQKVRELAFLVLCSPYAQLH